MTDFTDVSLTVNKEIWKNPKEELPDEHTPILFIIQGTLGIPAYGVFRDGSFGQMSYRFPSRRSKCYEMFWEAIDDSLVIAWCYSPLPVIKTNN